MVTDYGCIITGPNGLYPPDEPVTGGIQRHHVVGRTYKHKKTPIGKQFMYALCLDLHDPGSNHPNNVTKYRNTFTEVYDYERNLFYAMCEKMVDRGETLPFDDDVMNAIMDTKY